MARPDPRGWQSEAFARFAARIDAGDGRPAIVHAVMGAGKSYLIGMMVERVLPGLGECDVVVITAPSQMLVRQLSSSLQRWFVTAGDVGQYYGRRKQVRRVIVACNASVPRLAAELQDRGLWVGLWIADEAHKTECDTFTAEAIGNYLRASAAVGFTATPFRAKATEDLSLWRDVLYEYRRDQALRDGVITAFTWHTWTDVDASQFSSEEMPLELCRRAIEHGPAMANAPDIDHAERLVKMLTAAGIPAAAVHSRVPAGDVDERMEALRRGELRLVAHVNMLAEGVDYPWLRSLVLLRQTKSAVRFFQEFGRVTRADPADPAKMAHVYDPHGLVEHFGLDKDAVLAGDALEPQAWDETAGEGEGEPEPQEPEIQRRMKSLRALILQRRFGWEQCGYRGSFTSLRGSWRSDSATTGQIRRLQGDVARLAQRGRRWSAYLGRETATVAADENTRWLLSTIRCAEVTGALTKGEASDLIALLKLMFDTGLVNEPPRPTEHYYNAA